MPVTRQKNESVKDVLVESEVENDEDAGRLYVNVLSDGSCRR